MSQAEHALQPGINAPELAGSAPLLAPLVSSGHARIVGDDQILSIHRKFVWAGCDIVKSNVQRLAAKPCALRRLVVSTSEVDKRGHRNIDTLGPHLNGLPSRDHPQNLAGPVSPF